MHAHTTVNQHTGAPTLTPAQRFPSADCNHDELTIRLDCARGVGALPPDGVLPSAAPSHPSATDLRTNPLHVPDHGLTVFLHNTPPPAASPPGPTGLNDRCGSDFVQTQMQWPQGLTAADAARAAVCASFDGDADRIVFYSAADAEASAAAGAASPPRMLDGDCIAALVATFAQELISALPTAETISLGAALLLPRLTQG